MKLRILNNSLRVRLTISETKKLRDGNIVSATTQISPSSSFCYKLTPTVDVGSSVIMEGKNLELKIPNSELEGFINSNQVSLNYRQENGTEKGLDILLEKDYKCGSDPENLQKDFFPNPNLSDC